MLFCNSGSDSFFFLAEPAVMDDMVVMEMDEDDSASGDDAAVSSDTKQAEASEPTGEGRGILTLLQLDEVNPGLLKESARLTGLGKPGEDIYATRYVGDRLYLVTFRLTDPLYAIDLSDRSAPRILGELEIPGYSDYLHPLPDGRLLGIGKAAIADDSIDPWRGDSGRGAWYQGIKLSLFDVNDPTDIAELDTLTIGQRGTDSAALYDHHAFTYLPADGERLARIALPISLYDDPYDYSGAPWDYYGWSHTGLYLFEISAEAINRAGAVIAERREGDYYYDYYRSDDHYDRSVLGDNGIFYLHHGQLRSAPWGNPDAASDPL